MFLKNCQIHEGLQMEKGEEDKGIWLGDMVARPLSSVLDTKFKGP